jgi:hypothetical protein
MVVAVVVGRRRASQQSVHQAGGDRVLPCWPEIGTHSLDASGQHAICFQAATGQQVECRQGGMQVVWPSLEAPLHIIPATYHLLTPR